MLLNAAKCCFVLLCDDEKSKSMMELGFATDVLYLGDVDRRTLSVPHIFFEEKCYKNLILHVIFNFDEIQYEKKLYKSL